MQRFAAPEPRRKRARSRSPPSARPFEETGLLLGATRRRANGPGGPWAAFAQAQVPARPRRHPFHRPRHHAAAAASGAFDARFFTMDASAIAHRIEGVTGPDAELVELVWMPLGEAKQLDMPAVTGVMLEELGRPHRRRLRPRPAGAVLPMHPRGRFVREML